MKGDISDTIVIALLVITVFVSLFSTWILVNNVNSKASITNKQNNIAVYGGNISTIEYNGLGNTGNAGIKVEILPTPNQ